MKTTKRRQRVATKTVWRPVDLVAVAYKINPKLTVADVQAMVMAVTGNKPTAGTVDVWRTRLRQRGVNVPDMRTLVNRKT